MEHDINLYNAVMIAENPNSYFIVEDGNCLHAVDERVASWKEEVSNPEIVTPLMRDALNALIDFAKDKISPACVEVDWNEISEGENEQYEIIRRIGHIYYHLHHADRIYLSPLIHHPQVEV